MYIAIWKNNVMVEQQLYRHALWYIPNVNGLFNHHNIPIAILIRVYNVIALKFFIETPLIKYNLQIRDKGLTYQLILIWRFHYMYQFHVSFRGYNAPSIHAELAAKWCCSVSTIELHIYCRGVGQNHLMTVYMWRCKFSKKSEHPLVPAWR